MNSLPFPSDSPSFCASEPSADSVPPSTASTSYVEEHKHRPLFFRLCLAVLCERWAAFMLISTAALMLCARFGFPRPDALRLLGIASAANYFGSLPGGYLLDRTTNSHRGISISSLFLLLGYILLSLPYRPALYASLAILSVGHSLYKPSTQRILAALYPSGDSKIEGAQVLIHLSANIGAAAGSLLAGILSLHASWSVTYASAALVMSVPCALLWPAQTAHAGSEISSVNTQLRTPEMPTPSMQRHTRAIAGLSLAMFLFTLCTAQAEGALLLFCKDRIDRTFLGFEVPIAWFLAFPAVLVLALTPLQLALLPRLKQSVSTSLLIALGLVAASLCFAVLLPTTLWPGPVSMAWLAASLSLFVLAELLITPLGLALLLRSAPRRFIGLLTGLWYGAGALGYFLGGEVGALWSSWPTRDVLLFLTALPAVGAVVFSGLTRHRAA